MAEQPRTKTEQPMETFQRLLKEFSDPVNHPESTWTQVENARDRAVQAIAEQKKRDK